MKLTFANGMSSPARSFLAAGEWSAAHVVKLAGLALFVLAAWMIQHPYKGIAHDSVIYTLLALVRLNPEALSSDVYLRFSSQGEYTLFSPIFATAIKLLDLDPAAAWLTFVSQAAFFVCAGVLARRLTSGNLALLAVGLLTVLSLDYGSGRVFHCDEDFLTPRLSAAAFVFAALAASLSSRYILAGLCVLAALVLHPLMASAGVAMLFCLYVALPRPRLALAVTLVGLLASLALVLVNPKGLFDPFDPVWLKLVTGDSAFLFTTQWSARDWIRATVPLGVLLVGLLNCHAGPVRRVCGAALLVAVAGVALTFIYCDLLHTIIVTRVQPWRWLWLTNALAALLLPIVIQDCWKGGHATRASALLLLCAWVLRDDPGFGTFVPLAIAAAAATHLIRDSARARLVFFGVAALLVVAVTEYLLERSSYVGINDPVNDSTVETIVQLLRARTTDGLLYAGILAVAWYVAGHVASLRGATMLAAVGMLACCVLGPVAWSSWHATVFTSTTRAEFDQWRREIPPQVEVLWPFTPVGAWYFLDRPNFWSIYQLPGDVFSRPKALEMDRRKNLVSAAIAASAPAPASPSASNKSPGVSLNFNSVWVDLRGLRVLCADPSLGFVVTWRRLAETPFAPVVWNPAKSRQSLQLYRCENFRGKAQETP